MTKTNKIGFTQPLLLSILLASSISACSNASKTASDAPSSTESNGQTSTSQNADATKGDAQSDIRKKQIESDIRAREQRNNVVGRRSSSTTFTASVFRLRRRDEHAGEPPVRHRVRRLSRKRRPRIVEHVLDEPPARQPQRIPRAPRLERLGPIPHQRLPQHHIRHAQARSPRNRTRSDRQQQRATAPREQRPVPLRPRHPGEEQEHRRERRQQHRLHRQREPEARRDGRHECTTSVGSFPVNVSTESPRRSASCAGVPNVPSSSSGP